MFSSNMGRLIYKKAYEFISWLFLFCPFTNALVQSALMKKLNVVEYPQNSGDIDFKLKKSAHE